MTSHLRLGVLVVTVFWVLVSSGAVGWTAESVASSGTEKTHVVIKLASLEPIDVSARSLDTPPTVVLQFPPHRVAGSLPARSVIRQGVIEEIRAVYAPMGNGGPSRWIHGLIIELRANYPAEVRSEPGRVIVEIAHPAGILGHGFEVGLGDGIVVPGGPTAVVSERFQAMQQALARARPASESPERPARPPGSGPTPAMWRGDISGARHPELGQAPRPALEPRGIPKGQADRDVALDGVGHWVIAALAGLTLLGGWGIWRWDSRRTHGRSGAPPSESGGPVSSGARLIDQLVWRAFERQGYQLVQLTESEELHGPLRIVAREGAKSALLCLSDGLFFEKLTVEQFVRVITQHQLDRGCLVAPGAFTVPAQRYAKEHGVTLVGREELSGLLSEGAVNEHYVKTVQRLEGELAEAKQTIEELGRQLEMIRRQRNEASWFLGEERAKAAKREGQSAELTQQLRHWQNQAEYWEQAAAATKKQWEENEWYLGQAKETVHQLEEQLGVARERAKRVEAEQQEAAAKSEEAVAGLASADARQAEAELQRDEANWYLGELRESLRQREEQVLLAQEHAHHLEAQLRDANAHGQELEGQRGEAERALETARQAQAALEQQRQDLSAEMGQLREQLEQARAALTAAEEALETERRGHQAMQDEMAALHDHGERRRAYRIVTPEASAEVRTPAGEILFRGPIRDLSRTGFGISTRHLTNWPEDLRIQLYLPRRDEPITTRARRIWKHNTVPGEACRFGCKFVGISSRTRQALHQALPSLN